MFTVQWWNIPNVNCPTQFWQSDISKFMARTGKVRPCDTHDSVTKSDIYYNTTVPKKVWCDAGTVAVAEVVGSCVLAIRKSLTFSIID